jgi:O-antigen/teichoic acid export membrane protein
LSEKRIHTNALYNLLLSISQVVVPLLVFPYVSRVLGPDGVGQIGFIDNVLQMVTLIAALGIPIYGVREIAKVKDDFEARSHLFSSLFWIHFLMSLGVALIYALLILTLPTFQAISTLAWISLAMIFNQVLMMEWLFQGLQEFPYITKRTLIIRFLSIILIFVGVQTPDDAWIYFVIMFGTGTLNAMINILFAGRFVRLIWRWPTWRMHIRPLLYIFSFGLIISIYTVLDTVLLGFLRTSEEVGYYTISVRVTKLVLTLLTAVVVVTIPTLAVSFKEKDEGMIIRLLQKSFAYIVLIGLPAGVGLMVYAPEIVRLFAGEGYDAAIVSLQILGPTIAIIGFSQLFGLQILNPSGNEKQFLWAALIGMVGSLLLNSFLIPRWGHIGAAWTNLIAESTVLLFLYLMATRIVHFKPNWIMLFKAFLTCLLFYPIHWSIRTLGLNDIQMVVIGVPISIMLFFGIHIWVWKENYVKDLFTLIRQKTRI